MPPEFHPDSLVLDSGSSIIIFKVIISSVIINVLLQKVQKLEVVMIIIVGVTNVKCFCNGIAKLGDDAILWTGSARLRH